MVSYVTLLVFVGEKAIIRMGTWWVCEKAILR